MSKLKTKKTMLILGVALLVAIAAALTYYFVIYKAAPTSQSTAGKTCTIANNTLPETCIEDYIGLTFERAVEKAKRLGYRLHDTSVRSGISDTPIPAIYVHTIRESGEWMIAGGYFNGY